MAPKSIPSDKKKCNKDKTEKKTSCCSKKELSKQDFVTRSELEEMLNNVLEIISISSRRIANLEREVSRLYGYEEKVTNEIAAQDLPVYEIKYIRGLPLDYESIREHFRSLDI